MRMFKKNIIENKMVTVQKFRTVFTTVDGNVHIGVAYNYAISNRLSCNVPEYIMIDIKNDGYLKDHRNVMYPLANIISIDWQLVDEREVEDRFGDYRVFLTTEEVEKYS